MEDAGARSLEPKKVADDRPAMRMNLIKQLLTNL